eukprot:COSAG01_NODE_52006_length_350_cov_0.605578_1_plen_38_part_10
MAGYHDGGENDFPALKVGDADDNLMLQLVDMGETGDLH